VSYEAAPGVVVFVAEWGRAGQSRSRACLYGVGRSEFENIVIEEGLLTVGVSGRVIVREGGGVVVGFVCWRHTTMYDGTWVCVCWRRT
jgi:hypothetical protein